MRQIFVNPNSALNNAIGFVGTMAVNPALSKAEAKDKSFKGSVERNKDGQITKATTVETGWLTETEIEFS